jgi:mRNA guanylyltransferase
LPAKDLKTPHEETLLDGELLVDSYDEDGLSPKDEKKATDDEKFDVDNDEKMIPPKAKRKVTSFMIFDCLLVNGRSVLHESLPNRLKHVQNEVIHPFNHLMLKESFPFLIQLKTMFKPYHMQHLFSEVIPKLAHENDGLIFTPVEDSYRSGTCQRMLKWKPAHLNSVDFKLVKSEDATTGNPRLTLQVAQSGQHRDYAPFRPEPEDEEPWKINPPLGKILECRYDSEWLVDGKSGGWRYIRFREDKVMANAQHVVQKIIDSIEDNVKQEQLSKACDRIKKNWDLRHPEEAKAKRPKV